MMRRWAAAAASTAVVALTGAATIGAAMIGAAALIGCDDRADDAALRPNVSPPTNPAPAGDTQPQTMPAPATGPATTQAAAESMISIDGNLVLFPPARVRLDQADGKLVARLFSDDPEGALEESYDGNSFYLQIELDATDPKELDGMVLTYRAPGSERDDSPHGIFLEGRRWVLQPAEVRVAFEGSGKPAIDVQLNGTFLMFDSENPKVAPRRAVVAARLPASVQTRK